MTTDHSGHHGHHETKLGVVTTSNTIAADPLALRDIVQAAEEMGYERYAISDHVVGADPDRPGGWSSPQTNATFWHEPLVALGYLAGLTHHIQLMPGVLIMGQRATALVAKQAAEIDVLSGGRFILGIGIGGNAVEYQALNRDFHNRGRRVEEQIALLRALWREPVVTFEGEYERVFKAGINPLPSGDIPIWMGGTNEAMLDRIGRLGDGWYQLSNDVEMVRAGMERIRSAAHAAGRDPHEVGMQASVLMQGSVHEQVAQYEAWRDLGADYVMAREVPGLAKSPGEFIDACRAFIAAVGTPSHSGTHGAHTSAHE